MGTGLKVQRTLKVEVLRRKILEFLASMNTKSKLKTGCLNLDSFCWSVKSRTDWDRYKSK